MQTRWPPHCPAGGLGWKGRDMASIQHPMASRIAPLSISPLASAHPLVCPPTLSPSTQSVFSGSLLGLALPPRPVSI